jgi:hypothetical protein
MLLTFLLLRVRGTGWTLFLATTQRNVIHYATHLWGQGERLGNKIHRFHSSYMPICRQTEHSVTSAIQSRHNHQRKCCAPLSFDHHRSIRHSTERCCTSPYTVTVLVTRLQSCHQSHRHDTRSTQFCRKSLRSTRSTTDMSVTVTVPGGHERSRK